MKSFFNNSGLPIVLFIGFAFYIMYSQYEKQKAKAEYSELNNTFNISIMNNATLKSNVAELNVSRNLLKQEYQNIENTLVAFILSSTEKDLIQNLPTIKELPDGNYTGYGDWNFTTSD